MDRFMGYMEKFIYNLRKWSFITDQHYWKPELPPQIFVKVSNIEFEENL
jgi:hypothetical protein